MIYLLTTVITVILDQLSKLYIISRFQDRGPMPLIDGFLRIIYSTNTGAAFGMLKSRKWFLFSMAILLVLAGLIFAVKIIKLKGLYQLGLGLILGGTAGNLIDRVRLGYVVDFIDFSFWPTFNVADIGITVGAVLMIILILKDDAFRDDTEINPASEDGASTEKTILDGGPVTKAEAKTVINIKGPGSAGEQKTPVNGETGSVTT